MQRPTPESTNRVLQLEGPPIGRSREPKSETIARLGRENADLRAVVREECFRALEFLDPDQPTPTQEERPDCPGCLEPIDDTADGWYVGPRGVLWHDHCLDTWRANDD